MTHHATPLLDPTRDPDPVAFTSADGRDDVLLVCEHAGRHVPVLLKNLGLGKAEVRQHIAYDIGASKVAQMMAGRLNCALIRQNYSRLVIDCNRPPLSKQSIPKISDSIVINGNSNMSQQDIQARIAMVFTPYADLCKIQIANLNLRTTFSIHSFTPHMADGQNRPWDIGFLYRSPQSQGARFAEIFAQSYPKYQVGLNQPYQIIDDTDWFIPTCAEPRNIAHCLIEIRNDHIRTSENCAQWASRLTQTIPKFMESLSD